MLKKKTKTSSKNNRCIPLELEGYSAGYWYHNDKYKHYGPEMNWVLCKLLWFAAKQYDRSLNNDQKVMSCPAMKATGQRSQEVESVGSPLNRLSFNEKSVSMKVGN